MARTQTQSWCAPDAAAAAATMALTEAIASCRKRRASRCSLLDAKRPEQRLEEYQTQGGHALDRRGIAQPLSGPERSLARGLRPEKRPNPRRNHGRLPPTPSNPCPCGLVVIFPPQTQVSARPVSCKSQSTSVRSTRVPHPPSTLSPASLQTVTLLSLWSLVSASPPLPSPPLSPSLPPPLRFGCIILAFCIPSSIPYFSTFVIFPLYFLRPAVRSVTSLFFRNPFSPGPFFVCCFCLSLCSLLNPARPVHSQFFDPLLCAPFLFSPPSTAGASEKREAAFEVLESRIGSS